MIKSFIILTLTCLLVVRAEAQSQSSVGQKYSSFKSALPAVRLHFVFNQDRYSAGDTVFVKAYFLKDDMQPVQGRQLIDVNLVAPGGKKMQTFLFPVMNGVGANQVILPDTLDPGIYELAAYSSWMKNYETPPVFTKNIVVVGENEIIEAPAKNSLHITVGENNRMTITLPEGNMLRYQQLKIIVTNRGTITFMKSVTQGVHDVLSFDVPAETWLPGMNTIHVLNNLWMTVGGGQHYVANKNNVTASIQTDGARLERRKNATLTINVRDRDNQPVQGEFSIKILNSLANDTIQSTFAEDLAMSTPSMEPWRQIVLKRTPIKAKYNYMTDLARTGRVFLPDGNLAKIGTRMFFYMQRNDVMIQAMTSEGGRVRLTIPDISGDDELFYIAELNGEEIPGVKIVWDAAPIDVPAPPAFTETREPDAYGLFAVNKKLIDKAFQFNRASGVDLSAKPEAPVSELESRISGPDINIKVDDYVSFSTMPELIREIVPALKVRTVRGQPYVQMGLQQGIPESEPLYIIDGVVTKDTPFFLSLIPLDVANIKLITNAGKLVTFGLLGKNGIVIVETKTGNARPPLDASRLITGINKAIPFPQAKNSNIRRPDFRSTIYWNPVVRTDAGGKATVEFQCSDDLGPIRVRVDGMTSDGRPFSGSSTLNFVLPNN